MRIVTLAERPDLADAMWNMPNSWPTFMKQDPYGDLLFGRLARSFPEHQLVALDDAGTVVAKVNAVPFAWAGTDDDLPDRGWDAVLERGFTDRRRGREPTAVSLLEARVVAGEQGAGRSRTLLEAARANTVRLGLRDLFGPVRPTRKSEEPHTPMAEYVARTRKDGLPVDPWLRTHVRLGARVVRVCPLSMTIPGTLEQWREWTGLPFDTDGPVVVPEALVPVLVDLRHAVAVYVEPNVWVHHDLR